MSDYDIEEQSLFAEIAVSLARLAEFATSMRAENEANLQPYAERIIGTHVQGERFGLYSVSNEMRAAGGAYNACLRSAVDGLQSYVRESRFLIEAIDAVARNYARADLLAAERAETIASRLNAEWDARALDYAQNQADYQENRLRSVERRLGQTA
jgi:hypothetical protein